MRRLLLYPLIILSAIAVHLGLLHYNIIPLAFVANVTFFTVLPFIILLERVLPYRKEWNKNLGDFSTDIIQSLIILPLITIALEKSEIYLNHTVVRFSLADHYSKTAQFFIVLLVSEFLFYWFHRYSHSQKTLVRFHSVHHGAERLYWGNAGRFHFVDTSIQFFLYFIPFYLLGASLEVTTLVLTLTAVTGVMEHANIDYQTKFISKVVNTAELHHLHHSPNISECNKNYGKILIIFDVMFGTYFKSEEVRQTFQPGLPFNKKMPFTLWAQLKHPFHFDKLSFRGKKHFMKLLNSAFNNTIK